MKSRTLVVHTGGVGDFICALPAIEALGTSAAIEIAGIPERVALARAAGLAVAIHDLDSTGFQSVFGTPDARLCEFAARFDRALVWMKDDDGRIGRALRTAGIPDVTCAPGIPPADWRDPAADWYAHCANVKISLPYRADFGPAEPRAEVILQPGSGGRKKNWPLDNFERLAALLETSGQKVTWCYGPAEEALERRRNLLPAMSLSELAPVLAGARLYVGNDSGITHLAGISGCPTLAIYGPTDPSVWAPVGPRIRVLRAVPWPGVEDVFRAASEFL